MVRFGTSVVEGIMEENTAAEEKMTLISNKEEPRKGGLRTMPFVIVNEAFEKVASYGLLPNMIFYLMNGYNMTTATGTIVIMLWSSISNALSIFGAVLADSYMGRYWVIVLGSFSSLLGMSLLWLTVMVPQLKPAPCDQFSQPCNSATSAQLAVLFSSFGLISIGAGCIRPCSIAFGADQLDNKENPNNERLLQSFFNWYYAATGLSTIIALTVIVYIQENLGWAIGFAVPAILMVFSALMFLVGSSLYVKVKVGKSIFIGLFQVLVAAFRKRELCLPPSIEQYYYGSDSNILVPTNNLRCLNKACVISDFDGGLNTDGSASNPWYLCTVEQVESLKALLRVIPMWSTGIIMLVILNQNSFVTLQAKTMDRHITSNFEIPAASLTVLMVLTLSLWIPFYDRILVPLLARYTGQPLGLSPKVRMGIGLLLSCAAMATSAVIESTRRRIAIEQGLVDQPDAVIDMSALWLLPPIILLGLAEAFNSIGQIQFYYSQLPKSMSSIAMAIFTVGMAAADVVGSVLVDVVESVTSKGGKESWLSRNLNHGHLDYYYWVVAGLGLVNFAYFLVCCWAYGPSEDRLTENLPK